MQFHQVRQTILTSLQDPSWTMHIGLTSCKVPESNKCLLKSSIVPQSTVYILITHKVRHRNDFSLNSPNSYGVRAGYLGTFKMFIKCKFVVYRPTVVANKRSALEHNIGKIIIMPERIFITAKRDHRTFK